MEIRENKYTVTPTHFILDPHSQIFKFTIKNKNNKSSYYQIFTPDNNHFKIISHRSFNLAPGITKICKIQHHPSPKCHSKNHIITVGSGQNQMQEIKVECYGKQVLQKQMIEVKSVPKVFMKAGEAKQVQIEIRNISEKNLRLKVQQNLENKNKDAEIIIQQSKIILLANNQKTFKITVKCLKEMTFGFSLNIFIYQEEGRDEVERKQIFVEASTLIKNQFIKDVNNRRVDNLVHEMVNGATIQGCFILVNNREEPAPFAITEMIESTDFQGIQSRLQQLRLIFSENEGLLNPFSQKVIKYQIKSIPSQQDLDFIKRYSILNYKDETNAYKLRNSIYFKKIVDQYLKVKFGEDAACSLKFKNSIYNSALRINHNQEYSCFDVYNDTGIQIMYKIQSPFYQNSTSKGVLKVGSNKIEIQQKKKFTLLKSNSKFKQNSEHKDFKLIIPSGQIYLSHSSHTLLRPKSSLMKTFGMLTSQGRQGLILGDFLSQKIIEVKKEDYWPQPPKYIKYEIFNEAQLEKIQVLRVQKGVAFWNRHKQKSALVHIHQKGFVVFEPCKKYLVALDRNSLKYEMNNKFFCINWKQTQEQRQKYRISKKQLLFCFSQSQKQFQVVNHLQIYNKSSEQISVYCLSIDDQYFHSLQQDHKLTISPKSTGYYNIGFYSKSQLRPKSNKVTRELQFLIANQKETITCLGDLLSADILVTPKVIDFQNYSYGSLQQTNQIVLQNRGLNKVNFTIQHSQNVKVSPRSGLILQKGKQTIYFSIFADKISKNYYENINCYIKGSHKMVIPLTVHTQQPELYVKENIIDFKEGYINQSLNASMTLVNKNKYQCTVIVDLPIARLLPNKQNRYLLKPDSQTNVPLSLRVGQLGLNKIICPIGFVTFEGYGPIKVPKELRYFGKQNLLLIEPQKPFERIMLSQMQQSRKFKIKNLSGVTSKIFFKLSAKNDEQAKKMMILSCEPNHFELGVDSQREVMVNSIRIGDNNFKGDSLFFNYSLDIFINQDTLYRTIHFNVEVPPPQLSISPQELYFPLAMLNTWSRATFMISNKGYKEVYFKIKSPANTVFDFEYRLQKNNKLTKLNNQTEVTVLFKSKKNISFNVMMEIQDNFERKYAIKLFGTATNSPLLNCQKNISSSSKGFSAKEIHSNVFTYSLNNLVSSEAAEDSQNSLFLNKWIGNILPQMSPQVYNNWLKTPRNLLKFLTAFKVQIKCDLNMQDIMEQLKKKGYLLHTIRTNKLIEGNQQEWSNFIWFFLTKDFLAEDCIKWINKICQVGVETYESAFNHHKKILMDLLSKIYEPLLRGKASQWQANVSLVQCWLPIINKIENKRQLIVCLNSLYHKFIKCQKQIIKSSNLQHKMTINNKQKQRLLCWLSGNNEFEVMNQNALQNGRFINDRKTLSFTAMQTQVLELKIKDSTNLLMYTHSVYEPAKFCQIQLIKNQPYIHNVVIECQDKCSQQWKLQFLCQIQSEYFFEFSGGLEFKCKMPYVGVIKAGEYLQFRVIYTPHNLKEHQAVLKIANKYQQHIYNLKGKAIQSQAIDLTRAIKIPQSQRFLDSFTIAQDSSLPDCFYKVVQIGEKREQLLFGQAKFNKKELIVNLTFLFQRAIQDLQISLQVLNENLTFSKNIKIAINVIPKPMMIQAELRATIDKTVIQKIPLFNPLPCKQSFLIQFRKITKQQYEEKSLYHEDQPIQDKRQFQFKLTPVGKITLKPKEKLHLALSYLPLYLTSTYCEIKVKQEITEALIVYKFKATAQLPFSQNPLMNIDCQVESEMKQSVKIVNKTRQNVKLQVETNLPFLVGENQIYLNSKETLIYDFKIFALHAGEYEGHIIAKNERMYFVYPIKVVVTNPKKVQKIRLESIIRVSSLIEIQLNNKSSKDIIYDICCDSPFLTFDKTFQLPKNSEKALVGRFTPLFSGTKITELKLYNENMHQIVYRIQMVGEQHRQKMKIQCQLGEKKTFKLSIKNSTDTATTIEMPVLPRELSLVLPGQQFPIALPGYSTVSLQLVYNQFDLTSWYSYGLTIVTSSIGIYNFDLSFQVKSQKKFNSQVIHYDHETLTDSINRQFYIEFLNCFDHSRQFAIDCPNVLLNGNELKVIDNAKFNLKAYERKRIRCVAIINIEKECKGRESQRTARSKKQINVKECLVIHHQQFSWVYPVQIVQVYNMPNLIQIKGSSHEMIKNRASLKIIKNVDRWQISDFQDYQEHFQLIFISSREIYLQCLFNKALDYQGYITFYDQQSVAQKYPLKVKTGAKKYQNVFIEANVGETGKLQVKLKNGRGSFSVELKNNKAKQFRAWPLAGELKENQNQTITFQYAPTEYNGNKKGQAVITSQVGCFNFNLIGRFPATK